MNTETHRQLAGLIWQICNLLRGPYKRNEYRKFILPLTVLRRFDCLLAPFNEFKGKPEPDAELRDTENVPLKESIQAYFEREVLPHVPDAWIDHSKTKIGYEPPHKLSVIEGKIKALEEDIMRMLKGVTA